MHYAVPLRDLDAAWRLPAARVLVESMTQDDPGEVVKIDGADAITLTGSLDSIAALVRGLLEADLRVFARGRSPAPWERVREAPAVQELAEETLEFEPDDVYPRIDEEFSGLFGEPDPKELSRLRAQLLAGGCTQALIVWKERDILLDGHKRLPLCRELGIKHRFEEMSFPDRQSARNWMLAFALAKGGLSKEQSDYAIGRLFLSEKKSPEASQIDADGRLPQSEGAGETAERVAVALGVSRATVERCAAYTRAVDSIAVSAGDKVRAEILSGRVKLTRDQALRAAERGVRSVEELRAAKRAPASERDVVLEIDAAAIRLLAMMKSAGARLVSESPASHPALRALRVEIDSLLAAAPPEGAAHA